MKLFHVTTERKARLYRETGCIRKPVRGFDTLLAAMAWAMRSGRKVIYEVEVTAAHKLPDHHNAFGWAWWAEEDVPVDRIRCAYSAGSAMPHPVAP
jgi:hypothetical protein